MDKDTHNPKMNEDNIQETSLITQVQQETCDILTQKISSVVFLSENIRDIEFQIKRALGKQGIVGLVITPSLKYRGDFGNSNTKRSLTFDAVIEVVITENVTVNRANKNSMTCQDVAIKVAETLGLEHHGQYCLKEIKTGEDEGLLVSSITFDCLIQDTISV